jgi:hypothetical protein
MKNHAIFKPMTIHLGRFNPPTPLKGGSKLLLVIRKCGLHSFKVPLWGDLGGNIDGDVLFILIFLSLWKFQN